MIHVKITRKNGNYKELTVRGHAEYAEPGSDIVCAGVSALVITTENALCKLTSESIQAAEKDGRVDIRFSGENTPQGKLLIDALILGLTEMEKSYPNYLEVRIREV